MRLVLDASTLVGEMLRDRGLVLLASPHLGLYVPARMWTGPGTRWSAGSASGSAGPFRAVQGRPKLASVAGFAPNCQ